MGDTSRRDSRVSGREEGTGEGKEKASGMRGVQVLGAPGCLPPSMPRARWAGAVRSSAEDRQPEGTGQQLVVGRLAVVHPWQLGVSSIP
jgi:hypothetical protein